MTLDRWLAAATAGLPPEVSQRVRAEYAAHIAESDLPEAEAVAALGRPEAVRRALGRTYLSAERLETLRRMPGRGLLIFVWGILPLYGVFQAWNWSEQVPFPSWRLLPPTATLLLVASLWLLTRRLLAERRTLWRTSWGGLSFSFMLWLQWTLEVLHGEEFVWPWFLPLFGLGLLSALCWTFRDDRRLRRTLALEKKTPLV